MMSGGISLPSPPFAKTFPPNSPKKENPRNCSCLPRSEPFERRELDQGGLSEDGAQYSYPLLKKI
jgi:hypothetical protein